LQESQMRQALQGFDPANHQKERIAHLEGMKAMGKASADGERLDHVEMHNEHTLRDAKQQGRQGNVVFGDDGKVRILSEDEMGARAAKYWWGQNNTEVTIKCRVDADVKARHVLLATTSNSVKLHVKGAAVCEGALHRPIISDETTYALDDTPEGRLLTVTLTKARETSGVEHWKCAIKGEARADTSKFGVPVKTINPYDPQALKEALGDR